MEGSCFSLLPDSPPGGIRLGVAAPVNQAAGSLRVGLTDETGAAVPLKRPTWAQVRARGMATGGRTQRRLRSKLKEAKAKWVLHISL